jgi:hypothetical protein
MKNRNKSTKFPVVRIFYVFRGTHLLNSPRASLLNIYATQARIKKIMQKDEEVGKVAQATPIVICMYLSHSLPGILSLRSHMAS